MAKLYVGRDHQTKQAVTAFLNNIIPTQGNPFSLVEGIAEMVKISSAKLKTEKRRAYLFV